jgi:hypothetical protein
MAVGEIVENSTRKLQSAVVNWTKLANKTQQIQIGTY